MSSEVTIQNAGTPVPRTDPRHGPRPPHGVNVDQSQSPGTHAPGTRADIRLAAQSKSPATEPHSPNAAAPAPVIRTRQLTKAYEIYDKPIDRLKQMLWHGRRRFYREFIAVRGVDLDVYHGETVGIVGRNGSGKSTLLKLICGTVAITSGELEVHGRVAPLLTLGAGFNPEFTGRENVFLNAAILGLSRREIEERFDDIAAFADIGAFIDQPVRIYSSGMYARLAFAVAIHVDPDILVVDEILAVGDDAFRRKCTARMEQIKSRGTTILLVSHSASTIVELCDRAMLMEEGSRLLIADPKTVTTQYQRLLYAAPKDKAAIREEILRMDQGVEETSEETSEESTNRRIDEGTPRRRDGAKAASSPRASVASSLPEQSPSRDARTRATEDDDVFFVPALKPQSTVEYPSLGARIHDIELRTPDGRRVNVVRGRRQLIYTYLVTFDRPSQVLRFGMLMKTTNGFPLAGLMHTLDGETGQRFEAGQTVRVSFPIDIRMAPGTYFFNAGCFGFVDGDARHLHRIIDGFMCKVEPSARRRYITAPFDIAADPDRIATVEVIEGKG